jgi:hypothetical protein
VRIQSFYELVHLTKWRAAFFEQYSTKSAVIMITTMLESACFNELSFNALFIEYAMDWRKAYRAGAGPDSNQRIVIMRNQAIFTALLLTLVASSGAFAQNIYKWTDAEGNIHYGDRPIGAQAEKIGISSKPTDPQRIEAQAQARVSAQAKAAEDAASAPQGPSPEELRAEADERASRCSQYRQTQQKFVVSRRLYREDENGERVYLDETEMQAARDKVDGQVEEYCTS